MRRRTGNGADGTEVANNRSQDNDDWRYKLKNAMQICYNASRKRGDGMVKIMFVCHGRIFPNSKKSLCL